MKYLKGGNEKCLILTEKYAKTVAVLMALIMRELLPILIIVALVMKVEWIGMLVQGRVLNQQEHLKIMAWKNHVLKLRGNKNED